MVFVKSKGKAQPGFNIAVLLGNGATKGSVGIEVEVEGNKFPKPDGHSNTPVAVAMPANFKTPGWSYVKDGSLRGEDNAEYVLTAPIEFNEVPKKLADLWKAMEDYGSVLDESNRTSVHVHLNCQEFHLNRLTAFMALWFCFEEVLTEWCGEYRVGNLFCLRGKDSPAIISYTKKFIQTDGGTPLGEQLHYGGLNTNALFKFGSLEIRTLPGVQDYQRIVDWVAILRRLYDLSGEFKDPREICDLFSANGPLQFFDYILGDVGGIVRDGLTYDHDQIRESMYEGIRMAQDLCFCRDWDEYKPEMVKPDPFGRDAKKLASQAVEVAYDPIPVSLSQYTTSFFSSSPGLVIPAAPPQPVLGQHLNPIAELDEFFNEEN